MQMPFNLTGIGQMRISQGVGHPLPAFVEASGYAYPEAIQQNQKHPIFHYPVSTCSVRPVDRSLACSRNRRRVWSQGSLE